jgi:hypothetical protein
VKLSEEELCGFSRSLLWPLMREACCDVAEESLCRLCPDGSHPTDYLDEQCESISFLIEVGHAASEFEDGPTDCDEFRTCLLLKSSMTPML